MNNRLAAYKKISLSVGYIIFLYACKPYQSTPISRQGMEIDVNGCVLSKMKKLMDYEQEIKKYSSIYKDSVIHFDGEVNTKDSNFTSILELGQSSVYLWLIKKQKSEILDTILIYCVDSTLSVESTFDLNACQIFQTETVYFDNGEPNYSVERTLNF